jgi:hypothetical protein
MEVVDFWPMPLHCLGSRWIKGRMDPRDHLDAIDKTPMPLLTLDWTIDVEVTLRLTVSRQSVSMSWYLAPLWDL